MRQTLTWIAQRPSSDVLTCLRLRKQEDNAPRTKGDALYADYPVDVQVLRRTPVSSRRGSEQPFPYRLAGQRAVAAMKRVPRWAVAAAAVLVLGYAMFVGTPSVHAVTLKQLYEALQKASNVCIASILPDADTPRQKEWISRSLNLSMFEDRDVYALWDMSDRTIRTKPLENGNAEVRRMSDEVFARGQKRMADATGLVPFDEITNLPEEATWERVATAQVSGALAYDLVWTTPIPTIPPTQRTERFRFFVDPRTHLPSRLEMYSQIPTQQEPRCHKVLIVTYPTDKEILSLAQRLFPDFQPSPAVPQ